MGYSVRVTDAARAYREACQRTVYTIAYGGTVADIDDSVNEELTAKDELIRAALGEG